MKGICINKGNNLDSRLYSIWRKMHYRCENPKHSHYRYYGGRGIKVCDEWNSFVMFACWSIQNGYQDNLTIDRIDNDGNYEPSNCRWSTREEQANNRSLGEHVVVKNKVKSFSIRKRSTWEYRITQREGTKRIEISKAGFKTKEEAIESASSYIKSHPEIRGHKS